MGYEVLETVVTLVRHEHMLQVVWKTVESWQEECVESAARVKPWCQGETQVSDTAELSGSTHAM